MKMFHKCLSKVSLISALFISTAFADTSDDTIRQTANDIEQDVITWRRDIHQNPELGNREFRTAKIVADHMNRLGFEVKTKIAYTGVVGILRGGKATSGARKMVALRADMDALPVKEMVDLPFASRAKGIFNGKEVDVMHACGHDTHVAILMGVAEVMARMKDDLTGDIMFIFQPAEEGAPRGEEGGAELMIKEGIFEDEKPDAIFGLHAWPAPTGMVAVRPGPTMAASDTFYLTVKGVQTHGSSPWRGVDPIIIAAQIMTAIQTIPSRQLDITKAPAVITVGQINGGIRHNIIPDKVEMSGTIRNFDMGVRADLHQRLERTVKSIAESAGATVDLEIDHGYAVTHNTPELTEWIKPKLAKIVGAENIITPPLVMGAEDFSFFQQKVPGVYFFLGVNKDGVKEGEAYANHSPYFFANEKALKLGVKLLSTATVDYLKEH